MVRYASPFRCAPAKAHSSGYTFAGGGYIWPTLRDPHSRRRSRLPHPPDLRLDPDGPAIFHKYGQRVDKKHPAKRDEPLTIYATGLGVTTGGAVTAGTPAPSSPLAVK